MRQKILNFVKENKLLLLFLCFLPLQIFYFVTQQLPLKHIIIDLKIDRALPFIPAFIIPYILWYAYIPLTMLYMYFKERTVYLRQCIALFSGMALCMVLFVTVPTALPENFRPATLGNGIFDMLCKMIYANDKPYNICPSLHCFEAVLIHISAFWHTHLKKQYLWRCLSALLTVLICLSTVFIKQHSVIDVFAGALLAIIIYLIVIKGVCWFETV